MYADDTSIDRAFRTCQELNEELLSAFAKICKWLKINKLSLNTVKTESHLSRFGNLDEGQELGHLQKELTHRPVCSKKQE